MTRMFSNSEIQTFKECRRKWWLAWYRGLAPRRDEYTGVRRSGTRNHIALSLYYTPGYIGSVHPVDAHRKLAEEELALFDAQPNASEEERATLVKELQRESVMLSGYMEWLAETGADSDLEIIASEQYMEAELLVPYYGEPSNLVKIIGKLDTRTRSITTGRRKFLDHKNVQVFASPQLLRQNEQILHYEVLELLSGEESRCDGAFYNQLRRTKRTERAKPPFYRREIITHNSREIESYRYRLAEIIATILRVEQRVRTRPEWSPVAPSVVYPTPTPNCSWKCPFVKICPMFDDGSRVEDAIEAQFVQHNPLDYYGGSEREEL